MNKMAATRPIRRLLLLTGVICLLHSGCATILSGTTQRVDIQAYPSEATLMVLGGSAGSLLATSKKYGDLSRRYFDLISVMLPEADRQIVDKIGMEYFLSALIVEYKSGALPAGISPSVAKFLAEIPAPLKKKLLGKFSIEDFGVGSLAPELKRGRGYAVIGYQPGKLIRIEVIETRFNRMTLLNVFTLGLGVPVDLWTGAWRTLDPNRLNVTLNTLMPASRD